MQQKRFLDIKSLRPDSIYYIRVQAISFYGQSRLESVAETAVINTTISNETKHTLSTHNLVLNDKRFEKYEFLVCYLFYLNIIIF